MTEKMVKRNILLNPGPATTTNSVKYAQVVPDICPRENGFGEVMRFISLELTKFVGDPAQYTTVLFGGSGTSAIEAILSSVVGDGNIILVNNGAYGERMCQIANVYDLHVTEFKSSCYEAIHLDDLEACIQHSNPKITHLAIVHNETTTGLLNDIHAVGNLCKQYKIQLIVDAMSSFGAISIDMKRMNISYLASSSNKNLQGLPGVSFVIGSKAKIEDIQHIKPKNFYLNLYQQYQYFKENDQMRFTPPVQTLYALRQAIIELIQEGIEKRYDRYKATWETLIEGINRLGLQYLVHPQNHSKIITTILEPDCDKYNFYEMHDFFYKKGITIYPGKMGTLNTFRIANIGDIRSEDMKMFIQLLEQYLNEIGFIPPM